MISKLSTLFVALTVFLFSCGPETPELENDEELISTLILNFRNNDTGELTTFKIYDEDGNGPKAPVYTNGVLQANQNYVVELEVLNETVSPAEDITEEIIEEAEEHQFFFEISNTLDLEFSYDDSDANNYPIGLRAIFVTGAPSTGTLTTTLRHEPNKDAENVINGSITNAGGETDIQAVFEVVIE